MSITHTFVSGIADLADPSEVRPTNWNAAHTWMADTADPVSPSQGQIWIVLSGTSPSRVAALKVYDGGVTKVIASITY
jgi:hypothetical protein